MTENESLHQNLSGNYLNSLSIMRQQRNHKRPRLYKKFVPIVFVLFSLSWCGLFMISTTLAHESVDHLVLVETQELWTIDRLVQAMTVTQPRQIDFTEQYVSTLLTAPITKKGVFRFSPPAKLEKHVDTPQQESFIVNGDRVHYTNVAEDIDLTLSLTDDPSLHVFIGGFRAILSGDVVTLHKLYRTALQGTKDEWTLTIIPRDEEMHEAITSILFQGHRQNITTMVIHESNGNYSTLQLMQTKP